MGHRSSYGFRGVLRLFLITVAVVTLLALAWMHYAHPTLPVWLVTGPAVFAAMLLFATVVIRFARDRRDPDGADRRPRWLRMIDMVISAGVLCWFGSSLSDYWRHVYPGTPEWMSSLTALLVLLILTTIPVEIVIMLIYLYKRRAVAN